jgi:hypothetical protein
MMGHLYARYPARSCRSANGRYPPNCPVHGRGLVARFGADIALPDLLVALATCECQRRTSLAPAAADRLTTAPTAPWTA